MDDDRKYYTFDERTGKLFPVGHEERLNTAFAILSYVYLFLALGFFLWVLFDTWARKYTFALWLGFSTAEAQAHLNSPIFRSFAYAFVGGALGGVIAGYRSLIHLYSVQRTFQWRFGWKYLFSPWLGATLALFVYAVIQSGVSVIGGNISSPADTGGVAKMLFALATGSLVGYGSAQVVTWLDWQVDNLFKVPPPEVHVPDLTSLTQQEALQKLTEVGLMGQVLEREQEGKDVGKVIEQEPRAGSVTPTGGLVKITIAAAHAGEKKG
jgi:PASTA domain